VLAAHERALDHVDWPTALLWAVAALFLLVVFPAGCAMRDDIAFMERALGRLKGD
jgi:hypothetical protein